MPSTYGLNRDIGERLAQIGAVFNPDIVALSRELYAERYDASLPPDAERHDDIAYGAHERHKLDICAPAGNGLPVLLFVPGGGLTGGDKHFYRHIPAFFARRGFVSLAMNYRLAPEFMFPSGAEDVSAVIDWLVENIGHYGGNQRRLFVVGQSAGAIHSASALFDPSVRAKHHDHIRASILMSGVYALSANHASKNINIYFGNDPSEVPQKSPLNHVHESTLPVMLTVAEYDPTYFGVSMAEMMKQLTLRDGKSPPLLYLQGHNHLSPVLGLGGLGDTLGDALVDYIRSHDETPTVG